MRLLDLFCGAGGAASGYQRAGFQVTGVDLAPQPRYPFEIHQGDALDFLRRFGGDFDAIHASPPCQRFSGLARGFVWPDLVGPTREGLVAVGKPWIIENVEAAPLERAVVLCGTQFPALRVIRHRAFEAPFPILPLRHGRHPLVYTKDRRKAHFGKLDEATSYVQVTGGGNCSLSVARSAMGIDWMLKFELNEAVPPAYTEYVGSFLRRWLTR